MKLDGKSAIITGAASGIGKEIAIRFAREGAKVAVADLHQAAANAAAKEIRAAKGSALGVAMDVADEEAVIDEFPFTEWKKMLAIHLDGAFLTTKACLQHMYRSGRGGSVIYMGSLHSKETSLLKAPYVTAKHGLIGLCKVVAKEGAKHKVRANFICPGFVRTPLVVKQIPEQAKAFGISEEEVIKKVMLKDTVDGEFTTLEDVVEAVLFCASFPSNAMTGQSLIVSQGWCMQ
jgi:3-hydroxybutyrate dehydrogenase